MNPATAEAMAREAATQLPVYRQLPLLPVAGRGCELELADGRRILDLYGGHAVAGLGYGHPRLTNAICAQADRLLFQSNAVPLDVRGRAIDKLINIAPDNLTRAFFVNSGAEANENALRLALGATGRTKVLALTHGFHGRSAAAATVTWGAEERWYGFPRTPFDVDFIPRDDEDAARAMIDDSVAAVIFEPVQGIAGAYDLTQSFVHTLRTRTREVGALLIADEVQCGMGRTGHFFAVDGYSVEPDLLTSAKAIAGGLPCGALLCTEAMAKSVGIGDLGSTFGGGPLAAAALLAVIESIENEALLQNVNSREQEIRATCASGLVQSIQGRGLLLGLRLNVSAAEAQAGLLEHDILTGLSADEFVLRLLPPLVMSSEHVGRLQQALQALRHALSPRESNASI